MLKVAVVSMMNKYRYIQKTDDALDLYRKVAVEYKENMDHLNSKFSEIYNPNITKYSPAILVTKYSPGSSATQKAT